MNSNSPIKVVIALALSSFCMGVAELVMAGVLLDISKFFDISLPMAGSLTTIYALGVIIGAPILTVPLSRLDRRKQMLITIGIFTIANLVIFLSTSFYTTMFARFIAGGMHGVFFVIATLITMQISPKGKESLYLSIMVSGLTISLVSGVPLGNIIGEHYGFKMVFLLIFIFSLIALCGNFFILPKNLQSQRTKLKNIIYGLKSPKMLKAFFITASSCGATFVLYTYIQDFLINVGGFSPSSIGSILLVYGLFGIIGNLFGGKLTDSKGTIVSLKITLSMQAITLLCMWISIHNPIATIINMCFISFWAFASIAPLKMLSMHSARKYTPNTIDSSISVNEASFNIGIALATFIGGVVLTNIGIGFNPIFGALFVAPAIFIALRSSNKI